MTISLIVAMDRNRVIGRGRKIPWHLPTDLARFRKLTRGHVLIVGRKTFKSIGWPLPHRRTIVLSHSRHNWLGAQAAHSVPEALRLASGEEEVFVAGGAKVFKQFLSIADRIYMTRVEAEVAKVKGNIRFPRFNRSKWKTSSVEHHPADDKNEFPYTFALYERKRKDSTSVHFPVCEKK